MCVTDGWDCLHDERDGLMEDLRQYILSLIGAALICCVAKNLVGASGKSKEVIHIVCGIFMAITALSPIVKIEIPDLSSYVQPVFSTATEISHDAAESAKEDRADIIKEQTRAYILEKANSRNMDVDVEVTLDEENLIPSSITIIGSISPYDKAVLSDYIQKTFDIPEVQQRWAE